MTKKKIKKVIKKTTALKGDEQYRPGDIVQVHAKIREGEKERTQIFEGTVIAMRGRGENKTFTVRKIAVSGISVERIWPQNSPWVQKVVVKKRIPVRRAKLYYLRNQVGKAAQSA